MDLSVDSHKDSNLKNVMHIKFAFAFKGNTGS